MGDLSVASLVWAIFIGLILGVCVIYVVLAGLALMGRWFRIECYRCLWKKCESVADTGEEEQEEGDEYGQHPAEPAREMLPPNNTAA
jgi:hypothetical protein